VIVSFFCSAFDREPLTWQLSFEELKDVLHQASTVERQATQQEKLNAMMLSPAVYQEGGMRSAENATGADFTALDLDVGDWTIFAAAAWCRSRELAHIAYTTTKSVPAHHRFRLILPFDRRVDRDEYRDVWTALAETLPAKVDEATKDISRLSVIPYSWVGAFNRFIFGEGRPVNVDKLLLEVPMKAVRRVSDGERTAATDIAEFASHDELAPYATAALEGEIERVRSAFKGTRNSTLNRAAFSLGQLVEAGLLNADEVASDLLSASTLPRREALSAIKSGISAGRRKPRSIT
jgi:hypothetical protein